MSHAPSAALSLRHQTVRLALADEQLDALVVTALPNILYLTNFGGSSAIVVLTADRMLFLTDFRYVAAVSETRGRHFECPGLELVTVDGSYDATLARVLTALPSARVGFEASHLSVARHSWLQRALGDGESVPRLVPVGGAVEQARLRKDSYELGLLREGARRLSEVAAALVSDVRAGRTERDIALDIDWRIRRAGFEKTAFDTIVADRKSTRLNSSHIQKSRMPSSA